MLVTESGLDVKVLNETGTYIWQTLAAPSSFEQVLSALVGEFATAEAQARTDVTQFLEALVERGLIERIDGESP